MISTPRLLIKPFTTQDAEAFLELSQDVGFTLFPITIYQQSDVESAKKWIEEAIDLNQKTSLGKWGVWERESKTLIGLGGLTPWQLGDEELVDITYRLRESAWGKGYGHELALALVRFGFQECHLLQMTATITPDNEASKKVAAKLGMKYDQRIMLKGVPTDVYRLS